MTALLDAVTAADLPATLRDQVICFATEQSWHTLVPVSSRKLEPGDPEVGTVLELVVRQVGLEGQLDPKTGKAVWVWAETDPELQLMVNVEARLLKASDGTLLWAGSFDTLGAVSVRTFSAWAADDARSLREGLAIASEDLANQIADALFPGPTP